MEGAVRSGYLAAESLAQAGMEKKVRFIIPDMDTAGFSRRF
jgi:hypothetical protein